MDLLGTYLVSVEGLLAVIPESVGLFVVSIVLIAAAVALRAVSKRMADGKTRMQSGKDLS